jgi:photosystem II stability/assembly factor-like uncharacterized protein
VILVGSSLGSGSSGTWSTSSLPSSVTSSYSFSASSLSCNSAGFCLAFAQDYATSSYIVLQSTDGGSAFADITSNFGWNPIFYVYCSNINTAQCMVLSSASVYITTNGGSTWTKDSSGFTSGEELQAGFCPSTLECYVVGVTSFNICETTNGGTSWSSLTLPSQVNSSTFINSIFCSTTSIALLLVLTLSLTWDLV